MELSPRRPDTPPPEAAEPDLDPVPPPVTPPPLTALRMNPSAMAQDPVTEMQRLHEDMMRVLEETLQRFQSVPVPPTGSTNAPAIAPRLDLTDEGDVYVVHMDMPGVRKADISVQINGRTVTVSTRAAGAVIEQKDAANRVIRRERRSGVFQRSFDLPGPVVQEQMKANYEDGVLTITVPKAKMDQDPTRTIPVI
jgi:HSP20 family protein